jgi:hypothetical protein
MDNTRKAKKPPAVGQTTITRVPRLNKTIPASIPVLRPRVSEIDAKTGLIIPIRDCPAYIRLISDRFILKPFINIG